MSTKAMERGHYKPQKHGFKLFLRKKKKKMGKTNLLHEFEFLTAASMLAALFISGACDAMTTSHALEGFLRVFENIIQLLLSGSKQVSKENNERKNLFK